ncbi:mitochondrial 2-oxoglutarate/malate carrier protein-like [Hylaeus volcanicus]|uniref:mitochondrial 2-oxoglutarate/malate carrier protein-like n=1 Tax=Hylaeus volcanicus TaxID=313075 RepID=UPI0023B8538A|nr:mitochondrial 2-oxoglutarate/malate carrier protein-like [Hylaeus volcanicus]
MDVTKVRMQILRTSLGETIRTTMRDKGVRGFYDGWTAGLLRQLTYSTARLGMYTTLYDLSQKNLGTLNYPTMVAIGMISGIVGAFVGTPTDLVLVRMIADSNLPPEKRWNYRNGISGLFDIWKTEGVRGLWRGVMPTMTRGALVNGTQLATYSKTKMILQKYVEEGVFLQFLSAMISGLVMCSTSLPMDVAKTRIQNWNLPSKPPGILRMVVNIAQKEGTSALWRGFLPSFSRAAPNAVVTMICVEQMHRLYTDLFKPPPE